MSKTLVLIPSRLSATRLPNKPLLKIKGISVISYVYKNAIQANIGDVFVVTGDQEIFDDVKKNGGQCILTEKNHETGTDRIIEGFQKINMKDVDFILNLQGDEPLIGINDIINLDNQSKNNSFEITTLANKFSENSVLKNKNIVKVVTAGELKSKKTERAISFFRYTNEPKKINTYKHIGIYQYKVDTLMKYSKLKKTSSEQVLKLEQLRAIENDIKIEVLLANSQSIGIDTKEDFVKVKKILETKN